VTYVRRRTQFASSAADGDADEEEGNGKESDAANGNRCAVPEKEQAIHDPRIAPRLRLL